MGSICESPNVKTKKTYFNETNETDSNINLLESIQNTQILKTKVKLEFTIEGIEINRKYQVQFQSIDNLSNNFITETVISHTNIITFNTCYICDFFFEKQQSFNVTLIKDSGFKGSLEVSLGNIVGSPGSCFKQLINENTYIIITAQGLTNSDSHVEFLFILNNIPENILIKISNGISYLITSNGRKVYSSESLSVNGAFQPIKIPLGLLEKGFNVSFLNNNKEVIGTKNETTIQEFLQQKDKIYLNLYGHNIFLNVINKSRIIRNVSFIDYIKNGVTIKLTIGIDYTSSNLIPSDPLSLHYLGGNMNDYEQAIKACGMIVAYYDYNQLFPVYGFGAVVKKNQKPNMCFNVNFRSNPEIYTIDNVIKEYRKSFKKLILAGPTEFCPLIKKAIGRIKKENDPLKYHILLILTDGIIYDMKETVDALVEGSFLPLSVIIIGIGNDHFTEMIELDGKDNPLTNSRGVKRMRNLVHFVPFNKYKYNPNELAAQVLERVPRQITEYYSMYNIQPENLEMIRNNSQSAFFDNIKGNTIYNSLF